VPDRLLNLKAAIVATGRQQQEIAHAVNVAPKTLSLVVSGRAAPWPALRGRLVAELGVPEEQLFDDGVEP
jgi:transcriptional regulator with XRE-family HTH domain